MSKLFQVCVIYISLICGVQSARILGIFHMPAYSHFQLGDSIFKELAARGHEVTVITPFELKTPIKNLKHIILTGFIEQFKGIQANLFNKVDDSTAFKIIELEIIGYYFTESVLTHPNVRALLESNEHFDLVIHELFLNDAFVGFAHHYKAPRIIVSTQGASHWTNSIMGNSHNPSYMPDYLLGSNKDMTLYERTLNTLFYVGTEIVKSVYGLPNQNFLLQKYFPGTPHLNELRYNTSLMLLNSHVSTHKPVPLLPNMIEIGGYHFKRPKPLPKDLQDYLDSAENGVIYFSMGSNLKSKDMPLETRNSILKVLGTLKQKVLWKWEEDVLPGQPPNVKLAKWLPQQDILAHPNVKLFITHGGMLSTSEAIYHGVPILGLPVYGDQHLNILNAEADGYGVGVPFREITEASFSAALNEILNNPKYTKNSKLRSKLMHDRQEEPLDRAIYWIEYVLRYQGAPHLQTAALKLSWYQCMLLDVAAVITFTIIAVVYLFCKVVKLILKLVCNKENKRISKKKKKN